MPKRKFGELDTTPPTSECEDNSNCSSVRTNRSTDVPKGETDRRGWKKRKSVKFEGVSVYYFPRIQGFTCVPSEGGSTLGMADSHIFKEEFSLNEYTLEQRRIHKLMLEEQRQQGLLIDAFGERIHSDKESMDGSDSELDELDDYYFLQPISIRQRRTMLRSSGVKKININEKDDCKNIRVSRELCGCDCKVYCDPETCSCSLAGIKCQVDRLSFPCGCSKDGCGNREGRIEFNPIRVRTHFIHTLMRLELDRKEEECTNTKVVMNSQTMKEPKRQIRNNNQELDTKLLDLSEFNSNELGSCRDCQNSEVCNAMMQEVQYATMEAEHQRTALHNLYNSPVYKDVTAELCPAPGSQNHLPRVLLFTDSDDDIYNAENTTSFYPFKQEDNSYSEASECSSEGSTFSESPEYNKSYQNLSPFSQVGNRVNSEFCVVTNGQSFNKNAQNKQKYIELNTSSMYKLETLADNSQSSHCQYDANTTNSWTVATTKYNNGTDSFPTRTEPTVRRPEPTTLSCSYTTMTNTTSDQIAANCPGISSHMNSFKEQGVMSVPEDTNSNKFALGSSESAVFPATDKHESGSFASFHNMEEDPCLVIEEGLNDACPEKTIIPFFSESNKPPVTLNQRNGLIVPTNVSYSSNSTCPSLDTTKDMISCSSKLHDNSTSQNFGEIIKESIVETVSA
ncbi:hypothetical protein ScPMuIL_017225 [Solemya velum]